MTDAQLAAFRALLEDLSHYGVVGIEGAIRCREIALLAPFALAEIDRLKRGDFTSEEFQNLCHNLHERPGGCSLNEFDAGCKAYQRKLFGANL